MFDPDSEVTVQLHIPPSLENPTLEEKETQTFDPARAIVLFWDIDGTLLNSDGMAEQFQGFQFADFNGSERLGSAVTLIKFLRKTKEFCQKRGLSLINLINSAKMDALPESTVITVAHVLKDFFPPLNKEGIPQLTLEGEFLFRRYHFEERMEMCSSTKDPIEEMLFEEAESNRSDLLSPIHLVYGNVPHLDKKNPGASKVEPMRYVQHFFSKPIPSKNMFLIDNLPGHVREVRSHGFQAVSAAQLNNITKPELKPQRKKQFIKILAELSKSIIRRAAELNVGQASHPTVQSLVSPLARPTSLASAIQAWGLHSQTVPIEKTDESSPTASSQLVANFAGNRQPFFAMNSVSTSSSNTSAVSSTSVTMGLGTNGEKV